MLAIATIIAAIFVPMNAMAEKTSEELRADLDVRLQSLESLTDTFIELKQLEQSIDETQSESRVGVGIGVRSTRNDISN